MAWKEIISTTLGALQGSITVLLIMGYGYGARLHGLLTHKGERDVAAIVTNLCLPALLFAGIGPSATASTLLEYWPIIVYAVIIQLISYLYALLCLELGIFKSRVWTGACIFNNTISLPLLMLETLNSTGALSGIAVPGSADEAVQRARTYFLVYALVSHLTSFVYGPRLMSPKTPLIVSLPTPSIAEFHAEHEYLESVNEQTRLIPHLQQEDHLSLHIFWDKLKRNMNAPLLGGLLAIFIGIVPPLHSMFLDNGGFFWGSFTQSVVQVGNLYTALQMLVVGSQLYSSSLPGRQDGVHVSKLAILALFVLRFVLIPTISISFIYGIRLWQPQLLRRDPMFDFALMIAPVGPPAIHLAAIAELAQLSSGEKGVLSRVLMLSYMVTPFISVPIAATLAIVEKEGIVQ